MAARRSAIFLTHRATLPAIKRATKSAFPKRNHYQPEVDQKRRNCKHRPTVSQGRAALSAIRPGYQRHPKRDDAEVFVASRLAGATLATPAAKPSKSGRLHLKSATVIPRAVRLFSEKHKPTEIRAL